MNTEFNKIVLSALQEGSKGGGAMLSAGLIKKKKRS